MNSLLWFSLLAIIVASYGSPAERVEDVDSIVGQQKEEELEEPQQNPQLSQINNERDDADEGLENTRRKGSKGKMKCKPKCKKGLVCKKVCKEKCRRKRRAKDACGCVKDVSCVGEAVCLGKNGDGYDICGCNSTILPDQCRGESQIATDTTKTAYKNVVDICTKAKMVAYNCDNSYTCQQQNMSGCSKSHEDTCKLESTCEGGTCVGASGSYAICKCSGNIVPDQCTTGPIDPNATSEKSKIVIAACKKYGLIPYDCSKSYVCLSPNVSPCSKSQNVLCNAVDNCEDGGTCVDVVDKYPVCSCNGTFLAYQCRFADPIPGNATESNKKVFDICNAKGLLAFDCGNSYTCQIPSVSSCTKSQNTQCGLEENCEGGGTCIGFTKQVKQFPICDCSKSSYMASQCEGRPEAKKNATYPDEIRALRICKPNRVFNCRNTYTCHSPNALCSKSLSDKCKDPYYCTNGTGSCLGDVGGYAVCYCKSSELAGQCTGNTPISRNTTSSDYKAVLALCKNLVAYDCKKSYTCQLVPGTTPAPEIIPANTTTTTTNATIINTTATNTTITNTTITNTTIPAPEISEVPEPELPSEIIPDTPEPVDLPPVIIPEKPAPVAIPPLPPLATKKPGKGKPKP